MALELLEENHEWMLDGSRVAGVTDTLKTAGILQVWGDEEDRQRGKLVHAMVHMHFDKVLQLPVPEWLDPYLDGVQNFVAETGFVATAWEVSVCDRIRRYAGKLDCLGRMRGIKWPVIVDWKSGDVAAWTAIQTAGYAQGLGGGLYHRIGVSLKPGIGGGKNYSCKHYPVETLPLHTKVFNAALTIAEYKKAA